MQYRMLALTALVACGSSSNGSVPDASAAKDAAAHDAAGAGDAAIASCIAPGYGSNAPAPITISSVTATITPFGGPGIANLPASVTGTDISYPGETGSGGAVTISPNHALTKPMFLVGDGLTYARLGVPVTTSTATLSLETSALPATGAAMAAGSNATSGTVTITVAAGATITYDELDYPDGSAQALRAAAFPGEAAAPYVAGAPKAILQMFAVAPLETLFCPPAQVTVPNHTGLAAGAKVVFYGLGIDVDQAWEPFGAWQQLSTGQVSADGMFVTTDPGQGLPILDNFGIAAQ